MDALTQKDIAMQFKHEVYHNSHYQMLYQNAKFENFQDNDDDADDYGIEDEAQVNKASPDEM